ncbi:LuxR C-terminal-related transcriptional regulator [Micromonospora zamorensis]|uniref:response regulator transcription factor n=1 Tax=Micromonospora zamorensis TaxID=709883 RepID=UPI003CF4998D
MMPVSMVGRAGELAELDRAWSVVSAAGRSAPTVAVITGAAGVGKSLLVAAAVDALTPRPAMVLSGAARVHGPAPYDWLAAVLTGRDTGRLALPSDALAWLAQQPTAPRERYAPGTLLRLAVRTVQLLVGAGPAVLVVEDLHALDPASVNLIGELAMAELPALLVVASRPAADAVAPELTRRALARLSGVRGAVRQHLGPLRQAEVAEVLTQVYEGCDPSDRLVASLWRCTGGNPYALTELLAAHAGDGPEALLRRLPEPRPPVDAVAAVDPELTAREVEVLGCLVDGMSNKQVAKTLGISVRTVTVHVSNLLRKTGSASRTEVALWAVRRRPPVPAPVD